MISFQLLKELRRAEDEELLRYLVNIDGHLYITFPNKTITHTHITKMQKYIEVAYDYRAQVTESIAGLVLWVYPEKSPHK
jgi:hypothetical protein